MCTQGRAAQRAASKAGAHPDVVHARVQVGERCEAAQLVWQRCEAVGAQAQADQVGQPTWGWRACGCSVYVWLRCVCVVAVYVCVCVCVWRCERLRGQELLCRDSSPRPRATRQPAAATTSLVSSSARARSGAPRAAGRLASRLSDTSSSCRDARRPISGGRQDRLFIDSARILRCVVVCRVVWCVVWCGVSCGVVCRGVSCGVVCRVVWCVVWCGVSCGVVCRVVWCVVWCGVSRGVVCRVVWCVLWCRVVHDRARAPRVSSEAVVCTGGCVPTARVMWAVCNVHACINHACMHARTHARRARVRVHTSSSSPWRLTQAPGSRPPLPAAPPRRCRRR
jgi:hypothetical protein